MNVLAHWDGSGPGPWIGLVWALVVLVVVTLLVWRGPWRRGRDRRSTAEAVLAERYARGEISVDEYRQRLAVLAER